ncbi:CDPK-related kinase-like [Raphidocelis subcapitata]|uniref:CDPK-related kinase-like n=1 Tax=Raphidocelis subcapitata TaxID=307507 RepID=A0A2V0P1K8_9CHLO|nr:CDPK-related kinase-like [Raphidocelis subcapitata]|eukprot:GBF91720.1 CDPK-related kinase-like [Raphidocelis subcapitata]
MRAAQALQRARAARPLRAAQRRPRLGAAAPPPQTLLALPPSARGRGECVAPARAAQRHQPQQQLSQAQAAQQHQHAAPAAAAPLSWDADRQQQQPQQQQQQQQQPQRDVRAHALALGPPPALSSLLSSLLPPAAPAAPAAPRSAAASESAGSDGAASGCECDCGDLGWSRQFADRFALGPEVGRGSFGVVHEAVHKETGRRYAVKVLTKCPGGSGGCSTCGGSDNNSGDGAGGGGGSPRGSGGGASPASGTPLTTTAGSTLSGGGSGSASAAGQKLAAIQREVDLWAAVQGSRYVTPLLGLYEDDARAYLVQELVGRGRTLKALLEARGGRLEEAEAAAVMRGVLDVLCEAHRRDIAYGDVKPANFLVVEDGEGDGDSGGSGGEGPLEVRAVDFGCSRQVPLTRPCGSPLYMAPEMAHRRFGTAVDVWGAGVLLHQLLTGRLPFWTDKTLAQVAALPPYAIIAAVRTHDVSFPRATWAGISPEARQLVAAMLERNPAARISAPAALAHPWFAKALGAAPRPSGEEREEAESISNVVEFGHRVAALHL